MSNPRSVGDQHFAALPGYHYGTERARLFTEEGQPTFLLIRDWVHKTLETTGAFVMWSAMREGKGGDTWLQMAAVDRLVELGEIVEMPRQCWAQFRVFADPKTHNL